MNADQYKAKAGRNQLDTLVHRAINQGHNTLDAIVHAVDVPVSVLATRCRRCGDAYNRAINRSLQRLRKATRIEYKDVWRVRKKS